MKKSLYLLLVILLISLLASKKIAAQGVMREYCFQNNFNEANGTAPPLVQICTGNFVTDTLCSTTRTYYHFDWNCGFYFDNIAAGNFVNQANGHTIELYMRLDNTSGWRRIIDYKNRAVDQGVYAHNSGFQFYHYAYASTTVFNPGVWVYVAVVRDNPSANPDETYYLYLAGSATPLTQFDDVYYLAGLPSSAGRISFFQDDLAYPNEASSGDIALLRIYNYPLTGTQITNNSLNPCPCSAILPINWLAFNAQRLLYNKNHVELNWMTNMPVTTGTFTVLRSTDNTYFEEIEKIQITQLSDPHFKWIDKNAPPQTCFYKVHYKNRDGVTFETQTIEVEYNTPPQVQIFPTLIQHNQESVNLQIINPNKENVYYRMIDILGNTITEQELPAQNGQSTFKVPVKNLSPNMYFIQVRIGNQVYTEKIICVD